MAENELKPILSDDVWRKIADILNLEIIAACTELTVIMRLGKPVEVALRAIPVKGVSDGG